MNWIREEYSEFRTLLILCENESEAEDVVNMLIDDGFSWAFMSHTRKRETFWRLRGDDTGIGYLVYLDKDRIYHTDLRRTPSPNEEPFMKINAEEFISSRRSEEPCVPSELTKFLVGIMGAQTNT